MFGRRRLSAPGIEATPQSLSPDERSALHQRWRPLIPLMLALLSLVSLVLVLVILERRTSKELDRLAVVMDPARASVTEIELSIALEVAGTRGYLLTRDERFAARHAAARTLRQNAQRRLMPLAHEMGPHILQAATALGASFSGADAVLDSLYDGRLSNAGYVARIGDQQTRLVAIIADAGRLDTLIQRAASERRERFGTAQRLGALLSSLLAASALIALVLLVRLGVGFRARAIRLDVRERQQSALRDAARTLNASVSVDEAAQIIADGALAATDAVSATVELRPNDSQDNTVFVGKAMRDGASRSTTSPRALETTVVPLASDHRGRGALTVVRPQADAGTAQTEVAYLDGLMELASATLRRAELVSALRASEERFRQVADNIRGFIWLRDPTSSQFLYANAAYEVIWGRTRESLYADAMSWLKGVHPEDRARVSEQVVFPRPAEYTLEYRVVRPDGDIRYVWSRGFPVHNDRGEVYRMAGVTEDVTDWKLAELARSRLIEQERAAHEATERAHAAAERRREELERVVDSRARLVRGFTHDVKNPLGAADGFLSLLEEGVFGKLEERQRDAVVRARRSIRRALELIAGALDLARAEAGQLELQIANVDVRSIVNEAVLDYRAQAKAKDQAMTIDASHNVPTISSDATRIRQIVGNLLSNAIKYTPEKGRIGVCVGDGDEKPAAHDDWVVVEISDTGRGIPEDKLGLLFHEFTRLDPDDAEGGAGVGLAISQRLARALGGKITVDSRKGAGSRFVLWLPRSAPTERR